MTKAELVEEVSRVSDLTKKHSEVIVDTVFKSTSDAPYRREKIVSRVRQLPAGGRREPQGLHPVAPATAGCPAVQVPH
jgi:integration host factor subunit beta